jgi:nucleotide-binding universal stress UspA family protein
MSGIVCAIRGGPDSQPTIDRSIQLAAETGLPLYFLYVVNLDFLTFTASSRVHTISKELGQMGEFILLMAQMKAEAEEVTAKGIVRHGKVAETIIDLCRELEADYTVLGRPRDQGEEDVFTHERLDKIAQRIESETGTKVIFNAGLQDE